VPGHEIAGVVHTLGPDVAGWAPGDRVALHYLVACGDCAYCRRGSEQFCTTGAMLGKDRDGGYAEYVTVPARNLFALPDAVSDAHGAVMMCSSATVYHALRKARMAPGETVAVFGIGGLGASAVQIATAFGAGRVFAVDINPVTLEWAARLGAEPIDGRSDPAAAINAAGGADIALELVGTPGTTRAAVEVLRPFGRAVAVGLTHDPVPLQVYRDLIVREGEFIGSADHLASELPDLLRLAAEGRLDLSDIVTATVPLEADAVNDAMDRLENFGGDVRTVITP
ncbi:MAG: zinc-binding dehydrogenase, partial [Acidimicrobiia bacterium]|nr:zinc-binding dehydrogenase [Acidimicrobiia bacterium]